MGSTIYVGDVQSRKGLAEYLGYKAIAEGVQGATQSISQALVEHAANVRQEKYKEAQRLIDVGQIMGFENLGQQGLKKLEANLETQFPRDPSGNIIIPKNPEAMLNDMKVKFAQENPDVAFGKVQAEPSKAAQELERYKIDTNKEIAQRDRESSHANALIGAGATVEAARIHEVGDILRSRDKPENQITDFYNYHGRIRQMDADKAARRGLKPLTQGQVSFYGKTKKDELDAIKTSADINNIEVGSKKIAFDMAHLAEVNASTKVIIEAAAGMYKAGDKDGAAALFSTAISGLVDKDPNLKQSLEDSFGPNYVLPKWWTMGTLERTLDARKTALLNQKEPVLRDASGATTHTLSTGRTIVINKGP